MRFTKLNHLLSPRLASGRCPSGKQHCWVAIEEVRASAGGNIVVYVCCNNCNKRETIFLTDKEYRIQKQIINNSIKEQQEVR